MPVLALAQETGKGEDKALVAEFLLNPKNPFLSPIPKIKKASQTNNPLVSISPAANPSPGPSSTVAENKISLDLKVRGMVWGAERPQAIVNDQVVSIGDTIQEAKVIAITQQGVNVIYKGKKFNFTVDQ